MESLIGRKVSVVRLAVATHATNLGNISQTVTEDFKGRNSAEMTYLEGGHVHMKVGDIELVLSFSNIISIELKPKV